MTFLYDGVLIRRPAVNLKEEDQMKRFVIPVMLLCSGISIITGSHRLTAAPLRAVQGMRRDISLEQSAFSRNQRLASLLHPATKEKLDQVTRRLLAYLATCSENADPDGFVQKELNQGFGRLSIEQSDLLGFYVLAEAARILTVPEELKEKLDRMNEMSEMTSLRLRMTMDRRSMFISTLSNIMKKISRTEDTLVQNIK